MKKMNENLSEIFDVTPLDISIQTPKSESVVVVEEEVNDAEHDFKYARKNIKDLLKRGENAVDGLLKVAEESEHPRAYEVAANFIKTLSDMNKDLLDIQKKRKELSGDIQSNTQKTVIDKAVFIGSTQELIKMIKNTKE
jgi:hypothetical protein